MSPPPSPPPPPPPPQLSRTLASPEAYSSTADGIESGGGGSSISLSPSLLIIVAILAFVFVASASIHLLLRYLSRPSSPSSRAVHHHRSSSSSGDGAAVAAAAALEHSEKEKSALIESLPLFTLASSLATLPKSSPDCAVCLSPFQPDAELRLLPACRHAFHADCIDTWLRSTPSCPLCRASIALPHPPILQTPRSGSFRIEIGSISLRSTPPEANSATAASGTSLPPAPPPPPPHLRSYSIGSYDYFVEEEVEAVVPRSKEKKPAEVRAPTTLTVAGAPAAPGEEVAEEAGGGGRAWLKDYVDRLASTASSSFSSLRFSGRWSGRWSHRFEGGGAPDSWCWDLEGNQQQQREGEEAGYYTLYRWLVGI